MKKPVYDRDVYIVGEPIIDTLPQDTQNMFFSTLLTCVEEHFKQELGEDDKIDKNDENSQV